MENKDGDFDRTFRVKFSDEGSTKLAERIADTLKEYMGDDFVDETLVKYVIVLLGNGRRKAEVKEELDVFLGNESDSFVTWLWDHLSSNLNQYVGASQPSLNEVTKAKSDSIEHTSRDVLERPVPETDSVKLTKTSRSRIKRDWKGFMTEESQPPPLRSSVIHIPNEEKGYSNDLYARQSLSPERPVHRKRSRPDEDSQPKRDIPQANIVASRRLLQFAVRDAVATTKTLNSVSEPAQKRLRSVVSSSTGNLKEEGNPRRVQSIARVPNPMATAIRAVAEASKDVRVGRTSNVFDRLSRGDGSPAQVSVFNEPYWNDKFDDYDHVKENSSRTYLHKKQNTGRYNVNASMMDTSTELASYSASDNEEYDDVSVGARRVEASVTGTPSKADDSLMDHYSVAQDTHEVMRQSRKKEQDLTVSAANTKHKIVNISVNVNTWKPPHYQGARDIPEAETVKYPPKTVSGTYYNGKLATNTQKEIQKNVGLSTPASHTAGLPLEDVDSRTIFVNNVHFAATMDTLSRHFNKFGDVLKVIILTDTATGHPKGSAYVEFLRKEAADNALTLDGTSFMSRIIKVVKKSSAQPETNSMTWPRIARGSPFGFPRFAQAPFSRVFPSAYRARPPMKLGLRSMQWKRDAQPSSTESVASFPSNNLIAAGRGLTYIRSETKSDGNPGGA